MTIRMLRFLPAALVLGLTFTPVAATSADMATKGKCAVTINDRRNSQGRVCTGIALSKGGAHGGSTTVRIILPQYPHIVFNGPSAQPKPTSMVFTPSRVSYVEYRRARKGGKMVQVTTFSTRLRVTGKCDVVFNSVGTEVRKMVCSLETEVGKVDVKFTGDKQETGK